MNTADFAMMMGVLTGVIVGLPFALWMITANRNRKEEPPPRQMHQPPMYQQLPQQHQQQLPPIVIVHGAPYQGQRQPEQWHEIEAATNRQLPWSGMP